VTVEFRLLGLLEVTGGSLAFANTGTLNTGDVTDGTVIIDAKSGMTGAGKMPKASSHAGAVLENFSPYAVGAHRHAPSRSTGESSRS